MPDEHNGNQPGSAAEESRPVDLGLSEGKSMAFAPTSALQPEGQPIGGLAPAGPSNGAVPDAPQQGSTDTAPAAASPAEPASSSGQDD